ncbi:hypothetical protein JW906_08715 [bacterium]|nr:hypothetical protein [bacterium]
MSRNHESHTGQQAIHPLTRQEAERLFDQMRVSSTKLELEGGELRIHLVFENRDALIVKYSIRDHLKHYWLLRPGLCAEG